MIVVALFCVVGGGYIIRLRNIVAERRTELDRLISMESNGELSWLGRGDDCSIPPDFDSDFFERARPSSLRRILGDEAVGVICFVRRPTDDEVQHFHGIFPEAFIIIYGAGSPDLLAGPE
jgi:hypothetical protein